MMEELAVAESGDDCSGAPTATNTSPTSSTASKAANLMNMNDLNNSELGAASSIAGAYSSFFPQNTLLSDSSESSG